MKKSFNELPTELQERIKSNLKAYDRVDVYFEYGEYHFGLVLKSEYAADHEVIGTYFAKDIFTDDERIINYIESFHEYPIEYKGKRDYKMIKEVQNEKSEILNNGETITYPNWDAKFGFDADKNIIRIS